MGFSLFGARRRAEQIAATPAPAPAPAAAPAAAPNPADSPEARLAEAWKMAPVDPKQQAAAGPRPYFGNVDPNKIAAAAQSMDFLNGVDPALVEKAKGGDADAFLAVVNASNQNAFKTAMMALPGIIEPVLQQAEQRQAERAPAIFQQLQLRTARSSDPVFNNPAVAPVVEALKTTIASQNPQATPAQVLELVQQRISDLGQVLAPLQKQQQEDNAPARRSANAGSDDFSFLA